MYQALIHQNKIYFQAIDNRVFLNVEAENALQTIAAYAPDSAFNEQRCFENINSYAEFIKKNPHYKSYRRLSLADFAKSLQ